MYINYLMDAKEIAKELNVSVGFAYKLIRTLNLELREKGYVVVSGRLPRAFWKAKMYGYQKSTE